MDGSIIARDSLTTTQCADVTLVNNAQINFDDNCKNQTIKVTQENIPGNPNGTETETNPSSAASGSAASATPTGAAVQAKAFSWALGAVGVAGIALL